MRTDLAPELPATGASALRRALQVAATTGATTWCALRLVPPAVDLATLARGSDAYPQVLWTDPDDELSLLGLGAAEQLAAQTRDEALALPDRCRARLEAGVLDELQGVPCAFGGLAFDPDAGPHPALPEAPAAAFHLPELLLQQVRGQLLAWALFAIAPGTDPARLDAELEARRAALALAARRGSQRPPGALRARRTERGTSRRAWCEQVGAALAELGAQRKVVLARELVLAGEAELDPLELFARIAGPGPGVRFAFRFGPGAAFVGATPERLLRLRGDRLTVDALAGTAPRHPEPEHDARLAAELCSSDKERREHAFVVAAIQEALTPLSRELTVPPPRLMRLAAVQHLHTEVTAWLAPGTPLATLLARLYPTPAVCGTPREPARELIRRLEGRTRGWYAGAVGVLGRERADFGVAIRSAILRGAEATVFAGAGIVQGSDPEVEFEETERKARGLMQWLEERA